MVGAESCPCVSVCIPTYNRARYIATAIESVLNQTLQDFEIIVYDDASTDETRQVVQRFADPRIRYFRHTKRLGIPANRNACLQVARGRYIGWLDSDDSYLPHMLAEQSAVLDHFPTVGLVHARAIFIDEEGRPTHREDWAPCDDGEIVEDGFEVFKNLCVSNYVAVPTTLVRRACYEQVGRYNPELDSGEDSQMWLRIALRYDVAYRSNPVAYKRMHAGNVRSVLDARKQTSNRIRVVRSVFDNASRRDGIVRSVRRLAAMGAVYYILRHLQEARRLGGTHSMQLVLLSHAVRLDPSLLLNSDTWSLASSIVRSCEPEFQLARMKLAQHVLMRVQDTRIGKSWLEKWYPALPEQARIRVRHSAERASHRAKYQALLRDAELSLAPLPTDAGAVIALEGGFLLMHRDESGRWRPLDRRVPIGRFELPVFLTWLRERNVRYVVVPLDFPEPGKQTVFLRHIRTTAPLAREAVRWVMYRLVSGEERIAPAMQVIPRNARVLVVSKGDEALVDVDGWDAWHFPRGEGGGYAGYYPADSAEAIAHLEGLRVQGAQYLVFPRTSFWWLDHYPEFRAHLEQHYPRLHVPAGGCRVFALERPQLPQDHSTGATEVDPRIAAVTRKFEQLDTLNTVREAVQLLPQGARVLVVSKGDEALVNLDGWDGWHFPLGEDGGYAGYYPADSADAIEHLETLRAQGAQYLLFPRTSFWWLEHYPEFRAHLEQTYDAALEQDRNFLMITLSTSRDRVAPSSPETRSIEAGKRFG